MKKILSFLLMFAVAVAAVAADGFYTSGTKLMDSNGKEFIMRGCNYSYAWQTGHESTVIPAAKRIGCNTIRIQLSTGKRWSRTSRAMLERLIRLCEENKLVAVFNTHDETGSMSYSDLESACDFWISVKDVLNAHRKTVIVNISNEWCGEWNSNAWAEGYLKAIPKLRDAGIKNTLIVDCAGYGQYPKSLSDRGKEVARADKLNNIMFSIHMYQDAGKNESTVKSNIDKGLNVGVPLLIGEFAYRHQGHDVAWQTILDYTKEKNVGYLVWSWTGNSSDVAECDMFGGYDDSNYRTNGTNTVKGRNGIKATSKECSYYSDGDNPQQPDQPDEPEQPDQPDQPGDTETTELLWSGSVDMGSWSGILEYKPDNSQWKEYVMRKLQPGSKLIFTYKNVSTSSSAPGQIQLVTFSLDDSWDWTKLVEYADISGSSYTYTLTGRTVVEWTDVEMMMKRGFAVKGQNATLVKVEARVKGASQNSIGEVGADEDAPAEIYTLQGVRVGEMTPGRVYIVRRGSKVTKVIG